MPNKTLFLFRNDLRLQDNPALSAAFKTGQVLILLYVLDRRLLDDKHWGMGSASRWWLHHSLRSLAADIKKQGGNLILRRGDTGKILAEIIDEHNVNKLYFSRAYEPQQRQIENEIHLSWHKQIEVKRYGGYLLFEPEQIQTGSGLPYKVFTPFWKACLNQLEPSLACRQSKVGFKFSQSEVYSERLNDWQLLPAKPDWSAGLNEAWVPGEAGAMATLKTFLDAAIDNYDEDRNRPDRSGTSRLSPHLHFGEIAPNRIWQEVKRFIKKAKQAKIKNSMAFLRELGWRDFSNHLLFHWPELPDNAFRPEFERFPWQANKKNLVAWQRGKTGYPIVDAGLRELWHSGWMHNRVRMVVASFLIKHLLIDWREGEAWFWDTLVDADLANNAASWQWVAGSGADAAPYFRIFNPILQGKKFDPNGDYVRQWLPEIAKLPTKYIHAPWDSPESVLREAKVVLGETYPEPLLKHECARNSALEAYKTIKKAG